jgi:hypothetical protein
VAGVRSASLSHETKRIFENLNYKFTLNPAIDYAFCYALCRAYTTLNHTDASALDVCRHVQHWHWCGFRESDISNVSNFIFANLFSRPLNVFKN